MRKFSNEVKYRSEAGEIKMSNASEKYHFKGKTRGIALKYVAEGEECYLVNNEKINVDRGQFILIRQEEPYEAFAQQNGAGIDGFCIDLTADSGYQDVLDVYESKLLFNTSFDCNFSTDLGCSFRNLKTVCDNKSEGDQTLSRFRANLMTFFSEIIQLEFYLEKQAQKIITQKCILKSLLFSRDFIYQNYTSKITLDQLAKVAGISKFHFSRLFKNCFHKSPVEIQQELRMEQAKKLLLTEKYSFTEVACQLGYPDLPSFSRKVKQYYGVPPSKISKI